MSEYEFPNDLRYTREDEWIRVEGEEAVIGVSDYAQQQLGDIVFIELPAVGATLTRGDPFGVIESVKAVSDLYSPLSGTVSEVNEALADQPELVNGSCYVDGWIIRVANLDSSDFDDLLEVSAYRTFVEERAE